MRFKDLDIKDKKTIIGLLLDDLMIVFLISTTIGIIFLLTSFAYISIFNLLINLGIAFIIYQRYSIFIKQLNKYDYGRINGKDINHISEGYTETASKHSFYKTTMIFSDIEQNEVVMLPSNISWHKYDTVVKRDNIIDEILEDAE